jgi:hypothetical protein
MTTFRPELKLDKDTIRTAVSTAERFRYHVPFETIEEAKSFIGACCEANAFDYHLPTDTPPAVKRLVADRVHFFVALNAHNRGEFTIGKPFPNPQKLRESVAADTTRVLTLIGAVAWSRKFPSVRVATEWVAKQCSESRFSYALFGAVDATRFHAYVHYSVVRQAWESGKANIAAVPKDWVKTASLAPGLSLRETVDKDVERLTLLLPQWPAFVSVNAARNHVSRVAARVRFQYTGWNKVEMRRYRLLVHYYTAKRAFDAGEVALGPWAVLDEEMLGEMADQAQSGSGRVTKKLPFGDGCVDEVDLYDELMDLSDEPWFVSTTRPGTPSRKGSTSRPGTPSRRSSTPRTSRPSTPH